MKKSTKHGIFLAILAAALYALNSPFSKLLLQYMPSTLMAGFLYIGAGLGMVMIFLIRRVTNHPGSENSLAVNMAWDPVCNSILRTSVH